VAQDKRVIFIGSCSFSGSTILDLILGRIEDSISMGEVGRIYLPRKKEHFERECGCMQDGCNYWDSVLSGSPKGLHLRAFQEFGVSTLIDSTKDPHWIKDRGDELKKAGVEVINLLIWKTPTAIRNSFAKRGKEGAWRRSWKNYHMLYFSLIHEFYSVPFYSLLRGDDEFVGRLKRIGIEDYNLNYWEYPGHTLFGNDSAKRHLHEEGSEEFQRLQERRGNSISGAEDSFSHREIRDEGGVEQVQEDKMVSEIHDFLNQNDVKLRKNGKSAPPKKGLQLSNFSSSMRRYYEISKSIKPYFLWGISN